MILRIRAGDQWYEVEVEDPKQRPLRVRIAGRVFEVWPEEAAGQPSPPAVPPASRNAPSNPPVRAPQPAASAPGEIRAPIPGVVISVDVTPGAIVEPGQVLCVLEAMKMRNPIRASHAATVRAVHVQPEQAVKHGQLLVELDA
jgi:biotin carboxyl carrier protein